MKTAPAPADELTPWQRYQRLRKERGLREGWVAEQAGFSDASIAWKILNGKFGYPATAERRAALVAALNLVDVGRPVTESDIWPEAAAPV